MERYLLSGAKDAYRPQISDTAPNGVIMGDLGNFG
jgi:hypothetical protein